MKSKRNVLANNKKARHEYFIEETYETGIVLKGTEVKSVKLGHINIKESYAQIQEEEVFLLGAHISPYEKGNIYNVDPLREKKLLLKKSEIRKLIGLTKQKGYTLIPLDVYTKNGLVKVTLGLGKGKAIYDKRRDIAKKDANMKMKKALKERQRDF